MRLRCAAGVVLLALSTAVAGCGQAEQVRRKLDVKDAAAWIQDADAVRVTVSIDAEPGALPALVSDLGVAGDGIVVAGLRLDDPLLVRAVTDARLVMVGAPEGAAPTAFTATSLQAGGLNLVELVSGGGELFARLDAQGVATYLPDGGPLAGKNPAVLAPVLDLVAAGTGDLLRGRWIAADAEAVEQWAGPRFGGLFSGGEHTMPAVARVFEAVVRRATITEDPADPSHTIMTITGEDLRAVLGDQAPAELPPAVALDAYTVDGRLVRLSLDLTQVVRASADSAAAGSAAADRAPVRIDVRLEEAPAVRQPAAARRLELAGLPSLSELATVVQRGVRLPEPP